ncbi:nudix family protein [Cystoisospora suis]|uniref:Nudix family protein n=1 Tax=Cystoisospora suis TaxID=483139 RepID=A0A2C6L2C2_9APIC|nr:nudix family protein [Cystoisospora suis]
MASPVVRDYSLSALLLLSAVFLVSVFFNHQKATPCGRAPFCGVTTAMALGSDVASAPAPAHTVDLAPLGNTTPGAPDNAGRLPANRSRYVRVEEMCRGDWLKLEKVTYLDPSGSRELVWERFVRTSPEEHARSSLAQIPGQSKGNTERPGMGIEEGPGNKVQADSVAILAITRGGAEEAEDSEKIILVKQYRAAVDAVTVELPAGLVDAGETLEQAALRELKEETGFSGRVVSVGPKLTQSTVGREELHLVTVVVDLNAEENSSVQQELDDHEDIEVIIVPLKSLVQELDNMARDGYTIFDSLYSFAYGLHFGAARS